MGSANEKALQVANIQEAQKVLLEPQGHFVPWTDEKGERPIVAASSSSVLDHKGLLFQPAFQVLPPCIESHHPLTPERELEQCLVPRAPQDVLGRSILPFESCEKLPTEPTISRDKSSITTEAELENDKSSNTSLPFSNSILPITLELAEKLESTPLLIDLTGEFYVPTPSGIRSLGTIEELDEEEIISIDENLLDIFAMHYDTAASQLLAPPDRASNITDQMLEDSPLALASNNAGLTLQQIVDIPLVRGPSSLPPPVIEVNPAAVLSPLLLVPPPLQVEDLFTFTSTGASLPQIDRLTEDSDNKTPRPAMAHLVTLFIPETKLRSLGGAHPVPGDLPPTPSAPLLDTIPLPPFPMKEDAGLSLSESSANSGLGLIVPKNSMANVETAVASNGLGDIISDCRECKEAQAVFEEREGLAPTHALTRQGSPSMDVRPPAIPPDPFCASTVMPQVHVIQANMVENENNLIRWGDTPALTSQTAGQSPAPLVLALETETVALNTDSEKHASVTSEMKMHAYAVNIVMQRPELAREALQTPTFSNHSALAVDRFPEKIEEREGLEHTPDRPNWAKAPVEGDFALDSFSSRAPGDALTHRRHTANTPNWAVAPVSEHTHFLKSGRKPGCNSTRRGKKAQVKNPQDILIKKAPTKSVIQKPTKEEFEALSQVMPQIQFVLTRKQRKVAATRQKVSKWMKDSASVMVSPKSCAERNSMTAASCSAFLMNPVSKREINEDVGEAVGLVKQPLSLASRMAKTLAAQEARFHNYNESLEGRIHSDIITSTPFTSVDEHMDGTSLFQDDRKTIVDKGKKSMAKNPSPVGRQRSASVSSSLVSGISTRSGVSSSSRLFQHAIQQIGSPVCPRSASVDHTGTRQIPALGQDEAKEPLETSNTATETPEPLRQFPELATTPIATTAVTCPEMMVTPENCVPLSKGQAEASAPLHQRREISNDMESNCERLMFSFEPKQASIANEDHKKQGRSRDDITPYAMKLGSATVPTVREGNVMRTQRATSLRTFIPRGKYVSPPIREGQMERQTQAPPTPLATSAPPPGATTTSQAHDAPQTAQYPGAPVALTVTLGLNRHVQPINLSDDAFTQTQYHASLYSPAGSATNDVNDDTRLGIARSWSSCVEECESVRPMPHNNRGQINPNFGSVNPGANASKLHLESFPQDRCMTYHPNDLYVYDRQGRVAEVPAQKPCLQIPQQKMDYLTRLALAQEKPQDIIEFTDIASGYSEPRTFDPTVTTNQFQSFNVRTYESRVNFSQMMMFNEPRSLLQPPVCAQIPNPNLVPRPNLPPRLQNQTGIPLNPHDLLEEYNRRQRQETRKVHKNMPSGFPRRKS